MYVCATCGVPKHAHMRTCLAFAAQSLHALPIENVVSVGRQTHMHKHTHMCPAILL